MLSLVMLKSNLRARRASLWAALAACMLALPMLNGCGLWSDPGYIVYTVGEEGSRDIEVVRPSGEDQRVIITDPSDNHSPVWSPDRQRIAFISDRDGNPEIYVGPPDDSPPMRATNSGVAESHVIWSPDGTRLAYVSPDHRGIPQVRWLRLLDLVSTRLEFSSVGETEPAWSPDGQWIAFVTLEENQNSRGIRLRNPDGVNQVRVSDGPDWSPAWSPDGKKLAFVSLRDGHEEIYVVTVTSDGPMGEARRVTESAGRSYAPKWSPDSRRIAFLSDRDGNANIYTVNERGTDLQAVTRNDVAEVAFVWGPDGRIVFESKPTGSSSIFIADRDDAQSRLTAAGRSASQPNW